jgi:hypothetical protein
MSGSERFRGPNGSLPPARRIAVLSQNQYSPFASFQT